MYNMIDDNNYDFVYVRCAWVFINSPEDIVISSYYHYLYVGSMFRKFSPVLCFVPWQFSLRQVIPGAFQPPSLWSSSPAFPRNLHHSLANIFFVSSQHMPVLRQPTFVHFLGYFSYIRGPSNSFNPYSVQLGDSTHPPQHPHFHRLQLLCFIRCPCLGNVHLCCCYYHFVDLSVHCTHMVDLPLPFQPPGNLSVSHYSA